MEKEKQAIPVELPAFQVQNTKHLIVGLYQISDRLSKRPPSKYPFYKSFRTPGRSLRCRSG